MMVVVMVILMVVVMVLVMVEQWDQMMENLEAVG